MTSSSDAGGSDERAGDPCRVLVADDDRLVRDLVLSICADEGMDALSASNGAEALNLLRSERFDVLVLDLEMPYLSGWDIARRLQAEGATTPMIILSGYGAAAAAAELEADAGFEKPFDVDELCDALHRLCRQHASTRLIGVLPPETASPDEE